MKTPHKLSPDQLFGRSYPLGATVYPEGVNFCLYSKNARSVELLLFEDADATHPARTIPFDPHKNRTFDYWHTFIPGITSGQLYGYRVHGPFAPESGHLFDGQKVLLDPYARGVLVGEYYDRQAAARPGDNCGRAMKCVVVDPQDYDWEHDTPLGTHFAVTVIYEMHVAGFTRHPSSGIAGGKRGTYAGLIEKIPYLQELGITAVEFLPVQQFDEQDVPAPLKNYWGYSPIAFFAPHYGYSFNKDPLGPVNEFRDLVKALHKAGIEVILDVVFNHTAEGGPDGPTLCFRGVENSAYYILQENPARYADYTGCGNTFNTNYSVVRRLIHDCLRYWKSEMHIDGFRFDLASVMTRDEYGKPLKSPPILWSIDTDPLLAGAKIIAEPWDAGGLYQVGSFVGDRWAEWNGQFRDDLRRFVKGDRGTVLPLASRIIGSPDIYPDPQREPNRSINFVTCHDGFTLNDLVSYNEKHNQQNGENNHDGSDSNFSWNCGVEGPGDDPAIESLRLRQIKNFLTILMVSQGTPMLLMGDEIRRTQLGNNNAYCQDSKISWFDWTGLKTQAGLLRFFKSLIHFIQARAVFAEERMLAYISGEEGRPHIVWHGVHLRQPDLSHDSHSLAFTLHHPAEEEHLHIMLNAYWEPLKFELPRPAQGKSWYRIVDTALPSPEDFHELEEAPLVNGQKYRLEARSSAMLMLNSAG